MKTTKQTSELNKPKIYKGELFNTGKTWVFNNGQFGEIRHEKRRHCGELMPQFNRLHYWQESEGGQRFNSASLPIHENMMPLYLNIVLELNKLS